MSHRVCVLGLILHWGLDKLNHCPKLISRRVCDSKIFAFQLSSASYYVAFLHLDRNVVADETGQEEGGEADETEETAAAARNSQRPRRALGASCLGSNPYLGRWAWEPCITPWKFPSQMETNLSSALYRGSSGLMSLKEQKTSVWHPLSAAMNDLGLYNKLSEIPADVIHVRGMTYPWLRPQKGGGISKAPPQIFCSDTTISSLTSVLSDTCNERAGTFLDSVQELGGLEIHITW